ncbi:MAG: signal peptidase II [Verrucomicrobiota bacterium]|jgi:signal peptidase II
MISPANRRMLLIAALVLALDQATKNLVLQFLGPRQDRIIIDGFFRLVNWGNTGAAWSLFRDRNEVLAWVSAAALAGLVLWRRHFHIQTLLGQISLGLICGGIAGNLIDRINPARHQVVDFLRFYLHTRAGAEIGFPAFNVADSAICVGVGLLILVSCRLESAAPARPAPEAGVEN